MSSCILPSSCCGAALLAKEAVDDGCINVVSQVESNELVHSFNAREV